MNADKNYEELFPIRDEQFDRLVDSELSEAQRRELLCRLDGEPDGWRRCAMAFLEAQCWKQALGEGLSRSGLPDSTAAISRFWRWSARHVGTAMAMATCFFVALTLGHYYLHEGRITGGERPSGRMVAVQQPPVVVPRAGASNVPWQTVTLVGGTRPDGTRRYLRLPAVERDSLEAAQLQNLPMGIPDDLLDMFKRAGHTVRQSRELVPVRLEDGRRLVIPVDQLDVTGGPAEYQ